MKKYNVVRMNKDGSVGCDYGWGSKDWMMNMVYKEIEFCGEGEYVKIEKEELDDEFDDDLEE